MNTANLLARVSMSLVILSALACDVGNKDIGADEAGTETDTGNDTSTDDTGNDTSTGDTSTDDGTETGLAEECLAGVTPVGVWEFDLEAFPEIEGNQTIDDLGFQYTGQCELLSLDLVDGEVGFELACPHDQPEPIPVTIAASGELLPAGVEVGDLLDFEVTLGTAQGGLVGGQAFYAEVTERRYHLFDAEGPIAAAAFSDGLGSSLYTFGPLGLSLLPCTEHEFGDLTQGYWEVEVGAQTVAVAEGFVETISEGATWQVSNFRSFLSCCHGEEVGVVVLRQ
ncbi:hypothetical protein ACNOYE_09570 [Nannocystaceae bacterium ST9]